MIPLEASLLRMYVNAGIRWHGRPLYQVVVEIARTTHMAGASVFLVDLSYGTHHRIHDAKSEYTFVDIPVVIEIVDAPDRVEALLAELGSILDQGLATVEPVKVIHYGHHVEPSEPGTA
jgi:PII-like signaling protein